MTALESLKERLEAAESLIVGLAIASSDFGNERALTLREMEQLSTVLREAAEAIVVSPPAQLEQEQDDHTRVDGFPGSAHGDLPRRNNGDD